MNPILRNVLVFILAIITGSLVNMFLINISTSIIPLPPGADNSSLDGMKATMHLFEFRHFIMPFLAHALGTFTAALAIGFFAANNHFKLAMGAGVFFFLGGLTAVIMLPSPMWFNVVDLVFAYFPVAYLGWMLSGSK